MLRGRAELGRAEWINLLPLRQSNRVHLSQAFSYSVHHYPSMRRSSSPCSPSLTSLYPVASHAHISSEVPMLTQIHLITLTPPPTHSQLPPHSRSFILRTNFHAPLPLFRRVFLPLSGVGSVFIHSFIHRSSFIRSSINSHPIQSLQRQPHQGNQRERDDLHSPSLSACNRTIRSRGRDPSRAGYVGRSPTRWICGRLGRSGRGTLWMGGCLGMGG